MGLTFKEVATLRGDDKKFEENFSKIQWNVDSEKAETEKKIFKCFVVLDATGKAVCYLDDSLGVELETSKMHYVRRGYKILELSGEVNL